MSADSLSNSSATTVRSAAKSDVLPLVILKALGSLKITVAMFALAMLVVLLGTLAQDEMDLATVKREFFTCWIASVPLDVLFPTTLFPHDAPYLGGFGIYLPGGATIGFILLINLIAAKTTRFSVRAKGGKLIGGLLLSALGLAMVSAVIMSGHTSDGLQGKPPISYDTLWGMLKGAFALLTILLVAYAIMAKLPKLARVFVSAAAAISFAITALVLSGGESVKLDDPGLRIVWQLLQATVASSVVLAGLWIVFGKRGGNVLIHVGVGLLMVGQFVFGDRQIEQRISLVEGASTNLVFREDETEIVFVDTSDEEEDTVYAIPESVFRRAAGTDRVLDDPLLPCKVRIVDWMENSSLALAEGQTKNPATSGFGLRAVATREKTFGGAMEGINLGAAYVELLDRKTDKSLGILLLCQRQNDIGQLTASMETDSYESFDIDDVPFEVALRFRQERKSYDVHLKNVERMNYSGTETPRDYSSQIVITDRETGASQEGKTWMNNPIRYKGETFYQSRYNKVTGQDGQVVETTGLQVVKNAGWVVPYVSCMMVFVGMFAHFGTTFLRFANRYARGALPGAKIASERKSPSRRRYIIAAVSIGFCGLVSLYFAKPERFSRSDVDWRAIRDLPVQHEGRIKPFDTVARNLLQVIYKPMFGATPRVKDENGKKREPSEWLMGVMAGSEWVKKAEVFRIDPPEIRSLFELEARKGYRYSYAELEPNIEKFRKEIEPLRQKESEDLDHREQKLAQMHGKLNLWDLVALSYQAPPFPDLASAETEEERNQAFNRLMQIAQLMQQIENGSPPALLPPVGDATKESLMNSTWQASGPAMFTARLQALGLETQKQSPALPKLGEVLTTLRDGDAPEVNKAVEEYRKQLSELPLAAATMKRASAESWLNKFNPTAQGVLIYLVAIMLAFSGFLFRSETLRQGTFWILVGVFVIHTVAIIARIYVSGRAPVINLYSSAVFIGWACVLLGLFLEAIFPLGIANLASGLIGVSTLSVARLLDTSDTLHVLQAVLDTQFWLSTHVITVTAGYAVTFLAGFLGIFALIHRMATGYDSYPKGKVPLDVKEFQQILSRMIYGIVCFAIFFSFIGTVLGGLWADDSWGRFWGWDPKENGALMIVLWNALLLHAKWDNQVGDRGFAVLAVLGNIVTAWSWFGTNQLGIGLHSYGFTSGALYMLGGFMGLNLLIVVVSLIVTRAFSAAVNNANPQS